MSWPVSFLLFEGLFAFERPIAEQADDTGRMISGRGTMKQVEMNRVSRRREIQEMQTAHPQSC